MDNSSHQNNGFSSLRRVPSSCHLSLSHVHLTGNIAIIMVGMPARGKSYIANRISVYLTWLGYLAKIFNVAEYRRKAFGQNLTHDFFDSENLESSQKRLQAAVMALDDMIDCLTSANIQVALYDATNATEERRKLIADRLSALNIPFLFIESICTDLSLISLTENQLESRDYVGWEQSMALADFSQRLQHYEKVYRQIEDHTIPFIKVINFGDQFILNRVAGFLQSRIAFFLLNMHIQQRVIYLTRHGESEFNKYERIGGDSPLTERGKAFAVKLAEFMKEETKNNIREDGKIDLCIWTSTLKRAIQTCDTVQQKLNIDPVIQWGALDEIDAGICNAMTYEEIARTYPEQWAARKKDKLRYRYPEGESYIDVIHRIEPVIMELERQKSTVLVVGHQAVLRTFYTYYLNKCQDECPHLDIPLHTVIKIIPGAYGSKIELIPFAV